jgi:glycosyltransferase involved in cell wall biosynthesis
MVVYSHLRWDFVFQRPQHLLTRAAQQYRVLFFEEPIFERDACASLSVSEREHGIQVVQPHLPKGLTPGESVFLQRSLLNALLASERERPHIGWYYSPMALSFSQHVNHDICVYDCMDELSAFRGAPPELTDYERILMKRADVVFTGGQSLFEAKRSLHPQVHAFPSSIDTTHFSKARAGDIAEPADLAGLPHPRIGFFGVIDERLDVDLVAAVASRRPDWQIVMIGPVVKIDEATLPRLPNIHWLGGKPYADLPQYLSHLDMGWMPFAMNESTRFISPTKTPEFLSAGLPVVSTPIRDVVRPYGEIGLVDIAITAEEAIAAIENRLAADRQPWLTKVDRHLSATSWDKTWRAMQLLISQTASARLGRAPTLTTQGSLVRRGSKTLQQSAS